MEPTLGEVVRRLADDRDDTRHALDALDKRIGDLAASTVPGGVYSADRRWLDERFAALHAGIDALTRTVEAQQVRVASQRLVLLTGLVFPIVVAVVTVMIFSLRTG